MSASAAKVESVAAPGRQLTALILTHNEQVHIERCIESLRGVCTRVLVVDSGSTDRTTSIARVLGAEVHERPWPGNHADQLNFAIALAGEGGDWTLRIDADEYLSPELRVELLAALSTAEPAVTGLVLPRQVYFQGYPIRWGGFFPQWLLRVWRTGTARCESRLMDEHMVLLRGKSIRISGYLIDQNMNDIFWWTEKHNRYARREAAAILVACHVLSAVEDAGALESAAHAKRFVKEQLYGRLPLGFRALAYFFYRFFLRLGFLDHPRVWQFHFLQAAWYRLLVDVNIREFQQAVGTSSREEQRRFLKERWQITPDP